MAFLISDRITRTLGPLLISGAFVTQVSGTAVTHYVSLSGNHVPPFTNWVDAARDIQSAISVSVDGDTVLVTNGVYTIGQFQACGRSRIAITNAISVESVNGPELTTIMGGGARCAYVGDSAILSGFTLTNGNAYSSSSPGLHCVPARRRWSVL